MKKILIAFLLVAYSLPSNAMEQEQEADIPAIQEAHIRDIAEKEKKLINRAKIIAYVASWASAEVAAVVTDSCNEVSGVLLAMTVCIAGMEIYHNIAYQAVRPYLQAKYDITSQQAQEVYDLDMMGEGL